MKKIVIGMMAALVAGGMVCSQNMDLTTDLVDAIAAPVVEDTQSTDIAAVKEQRPNPDKSLMTAIFFTIASSSCLFLYAIR